MTNMSRRSSEGSIENQVIDTAKLSVQICIGVKPVLRKLNLFFVVSLA